MSKQIAFTVCSLCFFANLSIDAAERTIETIAGTGSEALNEITSPLSTNIGNPFGVEVTGDGQLFICEVSNHRLWQLDMKDNRLSLLAGTGKKGMARDGTLAGLADLNEPYEVRVAENRDIYFVEMQNHVVRKIDFRTRALTTVAGNGKQGYGGDDGFATKAMLNRPHSIALDNEMLYIADIGNHRIRRVNLKTGIIETFAGTDKHKLPIDGAAVIGQPVLGPRALFIKDHIMWVALREGHSVWKIDLKNPRWQHLAGTGMKGYSGDGGDARQATFNGPKGIAVDAKNSIYVVDTENQTIRFIDGKSNAISTLAGVGPEGRGFRGEGTDAAQAHLARPHGICVDSSGNVYIGDSENHRVRVIREE